VIAGVSPDDGAFAELVTSEGLKDAEVVPLGFVPRPYAWIAHADLCVLTSRYEGFSNFLLEAAAMGKRIVATDCPGGNAELLRCYGNGTLVPQDDPEAISEALAEPRRDLPLDIARSRLEQFGWPTIFNEYCEALFGDAAVPSERAAVSA
jgi:glycosyltransferase involved in cell wall biosynthesis